ncbi:MAG TPA: hypothetical protein VF530_07585 [Planctomycetota bacterium]
MKGEARLRGRIEDSSGRPIAGARVRWLGLQQEDTEQTPAWPWADWGVPARMEVETLSGPDGAFAFEAEPAGGTPFGSIVLALHPAHVAGGLDLATSPAEWPEEARIVLEPSAPLVVEVVDAGGAPRPGALVRHAAQPRLPTPDDPRATAIHERFLFQEATTDARGRVAIAPFRGEQALWAERDGLASHPWIEHEPTHVRLVLGPAFTLGGEVTMPDLEAWDPTYEGERRILVSGLSGTLWRPLARLRDVEPGEWGPLVVPLSGITRIRARFEGLPIVPIEAEFDAPPPSTRKRLDFHAEKQAELWFKVQTVAGEPIPTARGVLWWGSFFPTSAQRVFGAARPDGTLYMGSFPPGSVWFEITAPGYAPYRSGHTVPGDGVLVDLVPGGEVSGKCLRGGKPVRDFEVQFWSAALARVTESRTFLGREDGRFELGCLAGGDWWFMATDPEHPGSPPVVARVQPGQETELELELPTGVRGTGRVVDAPSGAPLPEARLQVYSPGGVQRGLAWGLPIQVAGDGSFDLALFVRGRNHLRISAPGYADADIEATLRNEELLDWGDVRLHRPQTLTVVLTGLEELRGFGPSDVQAGSEPGHVLPRKSFSPEGIVRFEQVPPGEVFLILTAPGRGWSRMHLGLQSGKEWRFEHRIAGPRELAVRLTEVPELPHDPSVMVVYRDQEGTPVVHTDPYPEEGWYRFEGLAMPTVRVEVLDSQSSTIAARQVSFGTDLAREVVLSLGEAPLRLRVLEVEGKALAGAIVLVREAGAELLLGFDDTDAQGWAAIHGVPEGPVLVDVQHPLAGVHAGIALDASLREQEVRFEAGGALELVLLDGDLPLGGATARLQVGRTPHGKSVADGRGRARFEPLGEGQYTVELAREDCWPATLALALAAGERAQRSVQMRRLGDVELTVLSQTGLPVAGLPLAIESRELGASLATWLAEERIQAPGGLATDATGKLALRGLPHGAYSWTATVAGEPFGGTFTVEPARTSQVPLVLAR